MTTRETNSKAEMEAYERECAILARRSCAVSRDDADEYIASHPIDDHELALFRESESTHWDSYMAGETPWEWSQTAEIQRQSSVASRRNLC